MIIKPYIPRDLAWGRAAIKTVRGRISSEWRKEAGGLRLDITVPANSAATVWVPAEDAGAVTESGKPVKDAEGIKFVRMDNKTAVFDASSGVYSFVSVGFASG